MGCRTCERYFAWMLTSAAIFALSVALTGCAAIKVGTGSIVGAGLGFVAGGPVGALIGAPIGAVGGNVLAENDRLKDELAAERANSVSRLALLEKRADDAQRRLDAIRGAPPADPHIFDPPSIDNRPWWMRPLGDLMKNADLREREL